MLSVASDAIACERQKGSCTLCDDYRVPVVIATVHVLDDGFSAVLGDAVINN